MQTFRRLNDSTKYYSLSWRGWLAVGVGGGLLYGAVRVSPLSFKVTLTIALCVLAMSGMVLYALSGQALGPGRYLSAIVRWRLGHKHYLAPPTIGDRRPAGGVLVDAVPISLLDVDETPTWWEPDDEPAEELSC